jgi:hypothetical protein
MSAYPPQEIALSRRRLERGRLRSRFNTPPWPRPTLDIHDLITHGKEHAGAQWLRKEVSKVVDRTARPTRRAPARRALAHRARLGAAHTDCQPARRERDAPGDERTAPRHAASAAHPLAAAGQGAGGRRWQLWPGKGCDQRHKFRPHAGARDPAVEHAALIAARRFCLLYFGSRTC